MSEKMTDHAMEIANAHPYLTSSSGRKLYLENMQPDDIVVKDVAHALSMLCRYGGHVSSFFSVAEHSTLVCRLAELDFGVGSPQAKAALVHDATEAYLTDLPSPIKRLLPEYKKLEIKIAAVVNKALGVPGPEDSIWDTVKIYDRLALFIEAAKLIFPVPSWAGPVPEKYKLPIYCYAPTAGEQVMLRKMLSYGIGWPLRT